MEKTTGWMTTSSRCEGSRSETIATSTRSSVKRAPTRKLSGIDARSHALLRIAALIAVDAAPPSFMSAVQAGLDAGATYEEIVGTLIAVMPIVGVARVVSAAPNLGLALGYDVSEAFEFVDG